MILTWLSQSFKRYSFHLPCIVDTLPDWSGFVNGPCRNGPSFVEPSHAFGWWVADSDNCYQFMRLSPPILYLGPSWAFLSIGYPKKIDVWSSIIMFPTTVAINWKAHLQLFIQPPSSPWGSNLQKKILSYHTAQFSSHWTLCPYYIPMLLIMWILPTGYLTWPRKIWP